MANCTDGVKTWAQIDTELHVAGWKGGDTSQYHHDKEEFDQYVATNATHCTPIITGYNDTTTSTGGTSASGAVGSLVALVNKYPLEAIGVALLVGIVVAKK